MLGVDETDLKKVKTMRSKQKYHINRLHRTADILFDILTNLKTRKGTSITTKVISEISLEFNKTIKRQEQKLVTYDDKIKELSVNFR